MDASRVRQSALWAVVMLNMAFADIVGFMHPGRLQTILEGGTEFDITPALLLGSSVLIEVPIAMVFLSLVLSPNANRWSSTAAAALTAIFVVGGGSAMLEYYLFAAAELAAMGAVVVYAWRGVKPGVNARKAPA